MKNENEDKKVNVLQWIKNLFFMRRGERVRSHWSYTVGFLVVMFVCKLVFSYMNEVQNEKRVNGGGQTMEQQEKDLNQALNTPLNTNNKGLSKEQQEAEAREMDGYDPELEKENTGDDPGYPGATTTTAAGNDGHTPERCLAYLRDYVVKYQMVHDIDEAVAIREIATEDADYGTCVNVVQSAYGYNDLEIRFK